MTSPFVLVPGMMLVLGLVPAVLSLVASFRRRRLLRGWLPAQATVTGNLHGTDGLASTGMHRFAPSYEFQDAHGQSVAGPGGYLRSGPGDHRHYHSRDVQPDQPR